MVDSDVLQILIYLLLRKIIYSQVFCEIQYHKGEKILQAAEEAL
jgi:hypothetical protein